MNGQCSAIGGRLVAIALALLAVPAATAAQDEDETRAIDTAGLVIEASAGWDGVVDQTAPIPISLLLSNFTDQMLEGELILSDSMNGYEVSLGEVVLAPNSTRRVTSVQAMIEWYECYATLRSGNRVLWRRELPLSTGQAFDADVNYALFVSEGGRRLQLPGAIADTSVFAADDQAVAEEAGRPFRCLTVKSFQIPDHFGPLVVTQAVIFPETVDPRALNRLQCQALADWVTQGGTVFFSESSVDLISRVLEATPLEAGDPHPVPGFRRTAVGLGAICTYVGPLTTSAGESVRDQIAASIAGLRGRHITTLVDTGNMYHQRGGRADLNRGLIVAFFLLYGFLSGVVSLLLFRATQRRVAVYTVTVVLAASIVAGVLGGMLRLSQGDLRWITVTQAGEGGAVQVGRVDVQSAGGRNTLVSVRGNRPDLQYIERNRWFYSYGWFAEPERSHVAFTWQPSMQRSERDVYQVRVPITPWGRRDLQAVDYVESMRPFPFELEYEPAVDDDLEAEEAAESESMDSDMVGGMQEFSMPRGEFRLRLVNNLGADLEDCWLIVGVTHDLPDTGQPAQPGRMRIVPMGRSGRLTVQNVPAIQSGGPVDVYHFEGLPAIRAGETLQRSFGASFAIQDNWDLRRTWEGGSFNPPRISRMGVATAWIVGRLKDSPGLRIDRPGTDFTPQEELHLFVQEIRPDEMPDADLFRTKPPADETPADESD